MTSVVLKIQSKGQIMLPKKWRDELKTPVYQAIKDGELIILKPVRVASDEEMMNSATKILEKNDKLLERLAK